MNPRSPCARDGCRRKVPVEARSDAVFCSSACRNAHWQRENAARHAELVRESYARKRGKA